MSSGSAGSMYCCLKEWLTIVLLADTGHECRLGLAIKYNIKRLGCFSGSRQFVCMETQVEEQPPPNLHTHRNITATYRYTISLTG
jgi:hypothetical protein